VVFPTKLRTIENRSVGYNHVRFSLCPLWNPVESEGAQATCVFTEVTAALTESPGLRVRVLVMSVSATRDVPQRLQIPDFDA